MIDFTALLENLGTLVFIGVPIVAFSWLLAGSDGAGLADIFAAPAGLPLPRGVQEEEPVRYRVERLSRTTTTATSTVPSCVPRAGRSAIETGPCV